MARKKNDVPAKRDNEGAVVAANLMADMEADAGAGFENASAEDYGIPFISILQKGSPQCDEDDDAYVEGARAGMFWDSGAMQILVDENGEPVTSIHVTPVYYERRYNQWRDRDEGGGFVGSHPADTKILEEAMRDERGRLVLEDGSYLADTRQFFCMLYSPDLSSARPVLIGMSSTQIRAARQWMTRMTDFKVQGKQGKFTPPMYGQRWELTTIAQSNAKGSWRGWKIGEPSLTESREVFAKAQELRKAFQSGAIQPATPAQGAGEAASATNDGEEVPF